MSTAKAVLDVLNQLPSRRPGGFSLWGGSDGERQLRQLKDAAANALISHWNRVSAHQHAFFRRQVASIRQLVSDGFFVEVYELVRLLPSI